MRTGPLPWHPTPVESSSSSRAGSSVARPSSLSPAHAEARHHVLPVPLQCACKRARGRGGSWRLGAGRGGGLACSNRRSFSSVRRRRRSLLPRSASDANLRPTLLRALAAVPSLHPKNAHACGWRVC